ncbi:glycosyltransferase family 2 protein [Maridesulfovibrio sp.]|uniref:glycosyltransferase family 2 protein n=1 Tax=Maridesulfovibrio sp. TaxID=2795000 RepID=UPI002A18B672|nr:glycosyltransferase family 2 protein [Maridesulfovibrio sp.]
MRKPYLSIIIPVLNLWEMTSACLESIQKFTRGNFYEVLVVDNGSTDATLSECPALGEKLFGERFRYVRVEKNINFGPACNLGADNAEGELLFFLNNDTLLTSGWVEPLLEIFRKDPGVAAVSPLCLFPDNKRVQCLGIGYAGSLGVCHPYFMFPGNHPVVRRNRRFQALSGAALMIPAALFREMGGFFPGYANGFEDMDLCCRLRRAGGRLVQENRSTVLHWASKTPGRNRFDKENMTLINKRCAGCFVPDLHRIAQEDGFRCELTPWLEMIMRAPDDPTGKIDDVDELRSALEEYPLWEDGYDKLFSLLLEEGRQDEAAESLFYGTVIFPDPCRLERLGKIAGEIGKDDWAAFAETKYTAINRALSAPEKLHEQAVNVLEWAGTKNDRELAAIYEGWISSNS